LESTLSTLADPKDRYRYAFSKTGVSVEEWNLIFPAVVLRTRHVFGVEHAVALRVNQFDVNRGQ